MAELQDKISKIQLVEQNIQAVAMQKQQMQTQLFEVESALKELEETTDTYKIIANIMVKIPKDKLKKELDDKKEIINLRMQTLEKQEQQFKNTIKELQQDVLKKTEKK
ncbi:prefoldin subunit beta [Candidatus Woesearchaeota archaeon]|nr:MAG: prefoldin subunit beta [Candidatus Woesearchaeota archaeon]